MIDLHTHTTASDGTATPRQLIDAALEMKLEAVAITDHDTFAGFWEAEPYAVERGQRLICGIELSTKLAGPQRKTVHLLGYFVERPPAEDFVAWLTGMQLARRDRNRRLAARLQSFGFGITIEEVEAIGRTMAGRPHFAKLMVEKGYCRDTREAFDRWLDESAPGYVDREEPSLEEGIQRIGATGGIASLAHPVRLGKRDAAEEEKLIAVMCEQGLGAIEAYHSDHDTVDTERYLAIGAKYGLRITGGSDFHGEHKPRVQLGVGPGHLNISASLLDELAGAGPLSRKS